MNIKVKQNKSILLIGLVWLLITLFFEIIKDLIDPNFLLHFLSIETFVVFLSIIFILFKSESGIFRIVPFFIIMLFLYLQGQLLLNVFNLTNGGILSGKFNNAQLINGILQVHIFIALFFIGCGIVAKKKTKCFNGTFFNDKIGRQVGFIILLLALPFEIYVNIVKLKFTINYGYASLYQEVALNSIPSFVKILSYFFLPGCFYVFFSSPLKSKYETFSILLLLMHTVLILLIGYRASAIIPLLLLLYGYAVKGRKSRKFLQRKTQKKLFIYCFSLALVIIFIFPLIRASRNSGGLSQLTFKDFFSVESFRDLFSTINDMGKSLQTVIYTLNLIPEDYPFRFGITYLVNLTEAIPNLFWDIHPAEAYGSLGRWLTSIVDPQFYKFGGALGFNCVSEAYVNFGWIGVCIIPIILGLTLQTVENKVENSSNAISHVSWVIVANYLLSYPRGELSILIRGIFWYMLIPLLLYIILKGGKK